MRLLVELIEDRRLLAGVAGALGVTAGAFLPWLHGSVIIGEAAERGIDGPGKVTVVAGAVALALVLAHAALRSAAGSGKPAGSGTPAGPRHRDLALAAGAAGLVALGMALAYRADLPAAAARTAARLRIPEVLAPRPGSGLWMTLAGGAILAVAAGLLVADRGGPPAPQEGTPEPPR